jgi:hypothetical protein
MFHMCLQHVMLGLRNDTKRYIISVFPVVEFGLVILNQAFKFKNSYIK